MVGFWFYLLHNLPKYTFHYVEIFQSTVEGHAVSAEDAPNGKGPPVSSDFPSLQKGNLWATVVRRYFLRDSVMLQGFGGPTVWKVGFYNTVLSLEKSQPCIPLS